MTNPKLTNFSFLTIMGDSRLDFIFSERVKYILKNTDPTIAIHLCYYNSYHGDRNCYFF